MLDTISKTIHERTALTATFAAVGGIWLGFKLWQLADFTRLHFLHRSSLQRYKGNARDDSSNAAWALVTGASDGIGRGFAEELCSRGFNVILHGRNEQKLNDVKADLLRQWPDQQIRLFVFDAAGDPSGLDKATEQLKDCNLKILINNVAAGPRPFWVPLADNTSARIGLSVNVDARFGTEITRALLPQLIQSSPAIIINIGSLASETACPYISVLSGTKAYQKAWSRSLSLEMKALGHDVEVLHILVGMVATPREARTAGFLVPTPRQMARGSLDKRGCGRDVVIGYWPHALHYLVMTGMPSWLGERLMLSIANKEKEKETKTQ